MIKYDTDGRTIVFQSDRMVSVPPEKGYSEGRITLCMNATLTELHRLLAVLDPRSRFQDCVLTVHSVNSVLPGVVVFDDGTVSFDKGTTLTRDQIRRLL